jgi:hypothetical protein
MSASPARARWPFAAILVLHPLHQLLAGGRVLVCGALAGELGDYYGAMVQLPHLQARLATDAGYVPLPHGCWPRRGRP